MDYLQPFSFQLVLNIIGFESPVLPKADFEQEELSIETGCILSECHGTLIEPIIMPHFRGYKLIWGHNWGHIRNLC